MSRQHHTRLTRSSSTGKISRCCTSVCCSGSTPQRARLAAARCGERHGAEASVVARLTPPTPPQRSPSATAPMHPCLDATHSPARSRHRRLRWAWEPLPPPSLPPPLLRHHDPLTQPGRLRHHSRLHPSVPPPHPSTQSSPARAHRQERPHPSRCLHPSLPPGRRRPHRRPHLQLLRRHRRPPGHNRPRSSDRGSGPSCRIGSWRTRCGGRSKPATTRST